MTDKAGEKTKHSKKALVVSFVLGALSAFASVVLLVIVPAADSNPYQVTSSEASAEAEYVDGLDALAKDAQGNVNKAIAAGFFLSHWPRQEPVTESEIAGFRDCKSVKTKFKQLLNGNEKLAAALDAYFDEGRIDSPATGAQAATNLPAKND